MAAIATIRFSDLFFHYSISEKLDQDLFDLHCHDSFEIYFFIGGEGFYLIEGRRYELRPYSLAVIRPGEVHCFKASGDSAYERCALHFSPDYLKTGEDEKKLLLSPFYNRELGSGNFYHVAEDRSILSLFNEFIYASSLPEEEKRLTVGFLLGLLLTKIELLSRKAGGVPEEDYGSKLVTGVLQCINDNLTEHLTLDDIASRFYVSKYHLSRIFKSQTGVSVIEYLIRKRVFLSQQLLKEGATAAEACARSGFGDYTSFYRAFKRIVGCPPLEKKEDALRGGARRRPDNVM